MMALIRQMRGHARIKSTRPRLLRPGRTVKNLARALRHDCGRLACAWFPSAAEHLLRFIAPGSRGSGRGPTCRSHSRQEPRALPPGTHTSERCSARTLPSVQSLRRPSQDWRTSRQHNACPCPFWGLRRSNPHVICGRPFTAFVPRVEYTLRLDQEELNLVLGVGLMFNTPRNHEHFSS